MFADQIESVVPGVLGIVGWTAVDDDRQFSRARDLHLAQEDLLLHIARRMIVVVIESDLAEPNHATMTRKRFELCVVALCSQPGFVWMNADAGIDPVVLLSDADRAIESAGPGAAADRKDVY